MQRREDLNYISKHPELTVALELIFENLCTKCDERGLSSQSRDFEFESPVQLTIDFLSDENLDHMVKQRLHEKKNENKSYA